MSNLNKEAVSKKIKEFVNIKDMKIFDNINDLNYVSSQIFNNIKIKTEILKYKMTEIFSNKNIKEGKNV